LRGAGPVPREAAGKGLAQAAAVVMQLASAGGCTSPIGGYRSMQSVAIREAAAADCDSICALNLAEVRHTSPMDAVRLTALGKLSCYFKVACVDGCISAFLLAMCSGAKYENENFSWFSQRYTRFIYVDRIVVSCAARRLGLGSLLYEDLFRYARANAIPLVTCEYNIVPPNEPSRLFHDKFGFRQRGTQWVAGATKCVSLQAAEI
jgi:predicted GNAT superfamily acetyltransferase